MDLNQIETIAFLGAEATHGAPVTRIDTSCASVFLAGELAYKIKRAVDLGYLDFTTLAAREAACAAELALNRATAPNLYLRLAHVTRAAGGALALDGAGAPIEPVVVMRRFADGALASRALDAGAIEGAMIADLGRRLAAYHDACPRPAVPPRPVSLRLQQCLPPILALREIMPAPRIEALVERMATAAARADPVVEARARDGWWRRGHGDLHLGNLCLMAGQLLPFDALEFDDELATGDRLYDLGFLIMDLGRRGRADFALALLDAYGPIGPGGGSLLPVFIALRALIRAFVAHNTWRTGGCAGPPPVEAVGAYLAVAEQSLAAAGPRVIAVGGLSGTGKSTLALALAPFIAPAPGALVLRSDAVRKALAGVAETERLPPDAYGPGSSEKVYARMFELARAALAEGRSVILDAVFARPGERAAAAALAADFAGLWLEAPLDLRQHRVDSRRNDASDATATVAAAQEALDLGTIDWHRLTAGGDRGQVLAAARARLAQGTSTAAP
ncbi:bifunctional aminoglycoside phosphotransferase/ATP-binding protein [Zavarzinia compransoris]|uniref:bifunctional aminoglycoside phosphotransferase/ATP-binding protein n=1 Tax=Zavarzinia compransoris TaxID=1264899 RepID=UPI0010E1EADB|nr:bifunctional aminoglycoside phosphotransferase/ATP-binding protein [Zavarzinia compransoris]TDP45943.1 hypothetical protein DES42_10424 [Zavarzinia compransoris]